MGKGLKALKRYRTQQQGVNVYADELLDIIEKELKALEIINDFGVNVGYIKYYFHKGNGGYTAYKADMKVDYLDFYPSQKTLEYRDFKLLKEVLK